LALGLIFIIGFSAVGGKMAMLASSSSDEVKQYNSGSKIINQRANIVDRNGNILATNMSTQALYAQPPLMINPQKAAKDLLEIFPDLNHEKMYVQQKLLVSVVLKNILITCYVIQH